MPNINVETNSIFISAYQQTKYEINLPSHHYFIYISTVSLVSPTKYNVVERCVHVYKSPFLTTGGCLVGNPHVT